MDAGTVTWGATRQHRCTGVGHHGGYGLLDGCSGSKAGPKWRCARRRGSALATRAAPLIPPRRWARVAMSICAAAGGAPWLSSAATENPRRGPCVRHRRGTWHSVAEARLVRRMRWRSRRRQGGWWVLGGRGGAGRRAFRRDGGDRDPDGDADAARRRRPARWRCRSALRLGRGTRAALAAAGRGRWADRCANAGGGPAQPGRPRGARLRPARLVVGKPGAAPRSARGHGRGAGRGAAGARSRRGRPTAPT